MQLFQEQVGDSATFQGVNLKKESNDATFPRSREVILSDSRKFLQDRSENFCSAVMKAAAVITDHTSWPRKRDELGLYGEDDVVALATHYRDVLQRNKFESMMQKMSV